MTARFFLALALLLGALLLAASLGAALFWYVAAVTALTIAFSLSTALIGAKALSLSGAVSARTLERGGLYDYVLTARAPRLCPIAPLEMRFLHDGAPGEAQAADISPRAEGEIAEEYAAAHVGVWAAGLYSARVHDVFEMFSVPVPVPPPQTVCVLPRPFEIERLKLLSGDDGRSIPGRASEDLTSPEDVRAYRPGDAMKKIHWKLSYRKRELLVRRFETPAPPDTLILLDCQAPEGADAPALRDALCETALSAARMQLTAENPVRVPFYGARATEYQSARVSTLPLLAEELARQPFSGGEPFERVLLLELRRMRRTGATVIITSRLTPGITQGVCNIRRMGATARFYLVTRTPDAESYMPYIAQMQSHLVEVCYVTPAR